METTGAIAHDRSADACCADMAERVPARAALLAGVFDKAGTLIRLARHQQLAMASSMDPCSYLVRSGCVALETSAPARHILGFLHGGDLLEQDQVPALPHLVLRAIEAAELWRVRQTPSKPLFSDPPDVRAAHSNAVAELLKRLMIANAMLGRLSGEARVASFLLLAAARFGRNAGNRVSMHMPMSRADLADHLGLNPDTLSRIVTSLKEAELIESHGRHGLTIRDVSRLQAHTPIAAALLQG